MKKNILILGIIFLLIGVSVVSSTRINIKTSSLCESNNPPYVPSEPEPEDGATDVPLIGCVSCTGGDPDPGDTVLYDIYFGDTTPPPQVYSNFSIPIYCTFSWAFNTTYYWKVVSTDEHGASTEGPIWIFTTRDNNPPYIPSNPIPPDGAENVTGGGLSWTGGDPDGDIVTYDVYFGEGLGNPPQIAENITNTTFILPGIINFNTTYSWKIVAWDIYGLNTSGPIWTFKTIENLPPNVPSNPFPADGAECVPIVINLSWVGGDPNPGDPVYYDVYFGVTDPPTQKSSKQTETCYDPPGELEIYKVYYWKVVAWDSGGLCTEGPIWEFTTKSPCAPSKPIIDGPTHGSIGVEYNYTFNSTYECGDLFYIINWGDDSSVEYVGPAPSGIEVNASHIWNKKGTYIIKARAEDEFGIIGPWGELTVTIPRDKSISSSLLLRFLEQYPLLNTLLIRLGLQ